MSATFNGTPINNATFSNSTITGYGTSLSLNAAMNQYVSIAQPFLPLFNRSWTFEAWIYPLYITDGISYPILAQMESSAQDTHLRLIVRERKLRLEFFGDDLNGTTNLTASRWYHTAFVFDTATNYQSIYLDGVLDATRQANRSYQGTAGALHIGGTSWNGSGEYFDGLIDQISFTNRLKAASEILQDATLVLNFSFDGNSVLDEGPLRVNGSVAGSTSFVSGRRGQALHICNVHHSYFAVQGLVLLGRHNQSYSFSIWIKPTVIEKSTIIHMSSDPDGLGSWCLPMIALSDTGHLSALSWSGSGMLITCPTVPANSWTHVASTYSLANGMRLYANGSLCSSWPSFPFVASGVANYFFVGSSRALTNTSLWPTLAGQYSGAVDELQVYSRELTASEINVLANP